MAPMATPASVVAHQSAGETCVDRDSEVSEGYDCLNHSAMHGLPGTDSGCDFLTSLSPDA